MRECLFTTLTDDYVVAWHPFILSLLESNPWFDKDFVILDLGLSQESRDYCSEYYDKIKFVLPQKSNYAKVNFAKTRPSLQQTFYKLDIFALYEYDLIVSIDLDMLVLGDISELFQQHEEFSACATFRENPPRMARDINSGLFVITNMYEDKYRALLKLAEPGHSMPDQAVVNRYFTGNIHYLPKKYNVEKRMQKSPLAMPIEEVAILHYVGAKPWQMHQSASELEYNDIYKLWWDYYVRENLHQKREICQNRTTGHD